MKAIFTFLFFTLISVFAFAGFNDGKITIMHLGAQQVSVEVDGKYIGNADGPVVIKNLSPGYHTVKVYYFDRVKGPGYGNDNRNAQNKQYIYSNRVKVKANYHIDIVINRFGKAFVDERLMDSRYTKEYDEYDYDWYRRDRNDRDNNRNNDRNNDRNYDNDRSHNRNSVTPISDQRFAALVETLRKESFESTRLTLAKQVADEHYFMSVQVKQLLQLFSFEESRLDLSKYLYRLTIDKENYFQLYDVFSFSSSKENLASYIKTYR